MGKIDLNQKGVIEEPFLAINLEAEVFFKFGKGVAKKSIKDTLLEEGANLDDWDIFPLASFHLNQKGVPHFARA